MSFWQELSSWNPFFAHPLAASIPKAGDTAPSSEQLKLPCDDCKPAIVVFLRHCGCPFAEKTFRSLRTAANQNPNIHFIAISHSDKAATERWLSALGGADSVSVILDHERTLYAKWGLGPSSFWHFLNPWSMWDVVKLGRAEGIWNKPTESGTRWQTSGVWAVDGAGVVKWGRPARQGSDIPNFEKGAVPAVS